MELAGINGKENIIINCLDGNDIEMVLRPVKQGHSTRYYLSVGWSAFRRSNNILEGGKFVFKYITSEDKMSLEKITKKITSPTEVDVNDLKVDDGMDGKDVVVDDNKDEDENVKPVDDGMDSKDVVVDDNKDEVENVKPVDDGMDSKDVVVDDNKDEDKNVKPVDDGMDGKDGVFGDNKDEDENVELVGDGMDGKDVVLDDNKDEDENVEPVDDGKDVVVDDNKDEDENVEPVDDGMDGKDVVVDDNKDEDENVEPVDDGKDVVVDDNKDEDENVERVDDGIDVDAYDNKDEDTNVKRVDDGMDGKDVVVDNNKDEDENIELVDDVMDVDAYDNKKEDKDVEFVVTITPSHKSKLDVDEYVKLVDGMDDKDMEFDNNNDDENENVELVDDGMDDKDMDEYVKLVDGMDDKDVIEDAELVDDEDPFFREPAAAPGRDYSGGSCEEEEREAATIVTMEGVDESSSAIPFCLEGSFLSFSGSYLFGLKNCYMGLSKVVDLVLLGSLVSSFRAIGGGGMGDGGPPPSNNPPVMLINNLDAGNPLHVHNSDNSSSILVPFKLLGTANYRMWNNAMSLMKLMIRLNSLWREFDAITKLPKCVCPVKCSCAASIELALHQQLMKLMQFLMGLDDCYQPVRTALLTRGPLPDVKDDYATVSREESHRGILETFEAINTKLNATSFAAKSYIQNKRGNTNKFNRNNTRSNSPNHYNKGPNPNLVCKNCGFTGHTIERCYELIGYPPGYKKGPNASKQNGFKPNFNANCDTKGSDKQPTTCDSPTSFTADQMQKLLNLINDTSSGNTQANMADWISFFNGNAWFNVNFSKFYCGNTKFLVKTITLGWIIDSEANQHLTTSTIGMINVVDISNLNVTVGHPNGTVATISHVGDLRLSNNVILYDVLVVPGCCDLDKGITLGTGSESGGLYLFDDSKNKSLGNVNIAMPFNVSKDLWHNRLGHPADQVLNVLKNDLNLSKNTSVSVCETCHRAKQIREPFPLSDHKSVKPGELVHLDLWGPYRVSSKEGFKYFLTIVDDYSRAVWTYLLKTKDEVFDCFINFVKLIHNQFDAKIKNVRSDNGTEFVNKKMFTLFSDLGIIHHTSCTHTPQQNGIAERKHRHLLNVARSLMFQGGIPLNFWSDCILTAVYLINRLPSSVLNGRSPYELLHNKKPNLSHLRCFGCLCFSTILNNNDKLTSRSEKCVLIGYSPVKKAYKLLSLDNRSVLFSRDVRFYENVFPFKMKNTKRNDLVDVEYTSDAELLTFFDNQITPSPNDEERATPCVKGGVHLSTNAAPEQSLEEDSATHIGDNILSEGNIQNENPDLNIVVPSGDHSHEEGQPNVRRSSRSTKMPAKFNDYMLNSKLKYGIEKHVNYSKLNAANYCFATTLNKSVEPTTCYDAVKDVRWVEAMNNEIEALIRNNTWTLTDLLIGENH
ncbi:putative RNA-directed DNA polymerase [Tanacetum coccineum]